MNISEFIVKTSGTCGGRARVSGRRIPVSSIYRWFLSGLAPEDILSKYESLTLAEVYASIAYEMEIPHDPASNRRTTCSGRMVKIDSKRTSTP